MFRRQTSDKVEMLRKVPLFQNLSTGELNTIARHTDEITSEAGRTLLHEGENARELLIVLEGTVRVDHAGQTITELGPGEFVGEMGLIDGKPRSADVVAVTPISALVIESRSFWPLVDSI